MRTSQTGIDLIRSFEGCCRKAYRLPGETYYTIGYGHYGADVKAGTTVTYAQAEELLRSDLRKFEGYVAQYAPSGLNQNQFDALVSFCYNCGPGSLKQLCTGRTIAQIPEHIEAYTASASESYRAGLLRRRQAERKLYNTPVKQEGNTVTVTDAKKILADKAGLSAATIVYLDSYKYGDELILKLAKAMQ